MKHCNYCQEQIIESNPAFTENVCSNEVCMNHAFEEEKTIY